MGVAQGWGTTCRGRDGGAERHQGGVGRDGGTNMLGSGRRGCEAPGWESAGGGGTDLLGSGTGRGLEGQRYFSVYI